MIQSYAATNQPPSVQRPALPGTLRTALWAMCAGAALAAVRAVVYAGTGAAQKAAIEQKYPHLGLLYDATHAETTLNLALGVAEAAAGLVAVVLLWQRGSGRYFDAVKQQ